MKRAFFPLAIFLVLLNAPVLTYAENTSIAVSDGQGDQGVLALHVTWNGMNVANAPVHLYTETGIYLSRSAVTDAHGHVQFTVPVKPHNFKVDYKGKEYWTGVIAGQQLDVEGHLEQLAKMPTNNPNATRYDGGPPVLEPEPIQVASIGNYIGILSQAVVAQIAQPKVYYYITDHLGTPMKMMDESGRVAWSADYRPFGDLAMSSATIENNFRFPGQYYDPVIGFHYNYHRYYDPRTGRYATPDPIGQAGGIDIYQYAEDDPINKNDQRGLLGWDTAVRTGINQLAKFLMGKAIGDQSRLDKSSEEEKSFLYMRAAAAFSQCMQKCSSTRTECEGFSELKQDSDCVNGCLSDYERSTGELRNWK